MIERAGFAACFDAIFCYTELGYRKYQPESWHAVQASLDVPPHQMAIQARAIARGDRGHPMPWTIRAP